MNNNTKNTNIIVGRHNLSRTFALWNNVKQSATTINELTESMSKDFHKPETYEEFKSMNRDVKKILQTAITLKRNMDVIVGRWEAAMILLSMDKDTAARLLLGCEDEPVKAPESPQNASEGADKVCTEENEETPTKPVVETSKVKTPEFSFLPTAYGDDPDILALGGLYTMPYATRVRGVMPSHRYWLIGAIKKVIDTLNDVMKVAATGNPFPARPEDFIHGVYCGFKNVKFTIIKHADWVPEGSTAVAVIVDYENGGFSCHSGRNVVVCDSNLREDVLEYCLSTLAEGANKLLTMVTSRQAK